MRIKQKKGVFITFEGTEGAGKSTVIRLVSQWLAQNQISHVLTREPGGSPISETIRDWVLNHPMNPWTELFLYEAARSEHMHTKVIPALDNGKWVICDRFTDSTLAYQGFARGLPLLAIERLNDVATQGVTPNLTVWLDIDPETGLKRAKEITRFEKEGVAFQKQVRKGFLAASKKDPARFLRIKVDNLTAEQVAQKITRHLSKRWKIK